MRKIIVIGNGISGMTCAIEAAKRDIEVVLVAPTSSERSQSVMAAGGINAALDTKGENDSVSKHLRDTIKGGVNLANESAVRGLCSAAPEIVKWLESIGTVFTTDKNGKTDLRDFGGHSCKRTAYSGASTGKQIVTALVREVRKYECRGLIKRHIGLRFHSALIKNEICYGAIFYNDKTRKLHAMYADAVVAATGGQNGVFGKTTGSALCDGYVAGKLFTQGVHLKNLEFIQYHPTTIETFHKRMLITEGARGEGGRLYYLDGGKRVYFMEDKYGPKGNLMPRDIVSRCIYEAPGQVYLDIAFLGKKVIRDKLSEVEALCSEYIGLDVTKESIPVYPSVHYFMGGIAVDNNHRTNISRLYAVGECASIYHGANRLGGNSLLSAIYSGKVAAADISDLHEQEAPDFDEEISDAKRRVAMSTATSSKFPTLYIKQETAKIMNEYLGISRSGERLEEGISQMDYFIKIAEKIRFDSSVSAYDSYSLYATLILARAILGCAYERKETRGAHIRSDYPHTEEEYRKSTMISYNNGEFKVWFAKEDEACNDSQN